MSARAKLTKIIGGGDSWFYLFIDGRLTGAAHEDDRKGMRALRAALSARADDGGEGGGT